MDDLPQVDDEIEREHEAHLNNKEKVKATRVKYGGVEEEVPMTMQEREQKWGFTQDELKIAAKVVSRLYHDPTLFVGDAVLGETNMYTMVSRDHRIKREHKGSLKKVMKGNIKQQHKKLRDEDLRTIQKTKMKQERDEALKAALLVGGPEMPMIEDRPEEELDDDADEKKETGAVVQAGAVAKREDPLKMNRAQSCHTCKKKYDQLHHYYYNLCPLCGDFNFEKRSQKRDLRGKVVILTGSRIKIGYAILLSLLRCGATVIATTRFPHDCEERLRCEADYDEWSHNAHCCFLDLKDLFSVTAFCSFVLDKYKKVFAIVNNAAQTIRRTRDYHHDLRLNEAHPKKAIHDSLMSHGCAKEWTEVCHSLPNHGGMIESKPTKEAAEEEVNAAEEKTEEAKKFHFDRYDTLQEMKDTRNQNSWTLRLAEVDGTEAAEVMVINALAPFIMNSKLRPALEAREASEVGTPEARRFVVNVSAMEGQFYRFKQDTHPHTNMAKAALNMMTRTSSSDYAKADIYMTSVDTGWITDESPQEKKENRAKHNLLCPLDEVDAAARVLDPIYTNSTVHGVFLKDYKEIPW